MTKLVVPALALIVGYYLGVNVVAAARREGVIA